MNPYEILTVLPPRCAGVGTVIADPLLPLRSAWFADDVADSQPTEDLLRRG
jgi:hypothetical protein